MGKMLIQQRRGKGSNVYRTPSFNFFSDISYPQQVEPGLAQVTRLIDDPGRSTPVAELEFQSGKKLYYLAAEGLAVGDKVAIGQFPAYSVGAIKPLGMVPEGSPVFNVERHPGDGGRFARASGTSAIVVAHDEETSAVTLQLSSKHTLVLSPLCRATLGVASGGGRLEKPMMKAGTHFYAAMARGRRFPYVRGTAMNAYDHPHGGRSFGKSTTVSRNAPPGRKVGQVAARGTGRKKSKSRENAQ